MLLKVTVDEKRDFLPMLKTDGEFWQAPKTLHRGECVEVKDFIGYGLMNEYKGCFEVIQADPIKDAVDNTITLKDVQPDKAKPRRATKDIKTHQLSHQEAALQTAAEFSPLAAERIESAQADEPGDKNALKNGPKPGDGHDKVASSEADKLAHAKADAAKAEAEKAKADHVKK